MIGQIGVTLPKGRTAAVALSLMMATLIVWHHDLGFNAGVLSKQIKEITPI
jgi:hypothetical protein